MNIACHNNSDLSTKDERAINVMRANQNTDGVSTAILLIPKDSYIKSRALIERKNFKKMGDGKVLY